MVSQRQSKRVSDATVLRLQAALRNSELKRRTLFELSPVGMAVVNSSTGQFEEVNTALLGLVGYSRDLLLTKTFADIVHADIPLPAGAPGTRFGPMEYEFRRADGRPTPLMVSGVLESPGDADQTLIAVCGLADSSSMHEHVAAVALTDPLTGLPNRFAFVKALDKAIGDYAFNENSGFAVLCIDVDRFKLVNDAMGHAAGDELLCHIAQRLRATVRLSDRGPAGSAPGMAARFGSDEFAVLLTGLSRAGGIEGIAERLMTALAEPYDIYGRSIHSSASIGIALGERDCRDALKIIQRADVAMFEAKQRGRTRAVAFDEHMQNRLSRRLLLENDLRSALLKEGLSVVYQPIVDLENGTMTSAEALVRWTHPTLGPISPAEFVPIAEESGLVVPLGNYVLREACRQFLAWRRSDLDRAPETISINLSRTELALGHAYIERLRNTLKEVGMDPHLLQLEVTEREIARDPALSISLMHALKETGVRLAMDDFGTGASSLSCLRHLPFDTVKIDQSFLASLESERDVLMVLHATVTLIENLGMCSVAEGIERASQVAVLQSIRCRRGQGYLFSRPLAGDLLTAVDCLAFRNTAHA
jgi:diguanylate cyclase (GGDEF)-like protein/PAS domain S-box-containing protein